MWENPLEEAAINADEETMAFVDKQRLLQKENAAQASKPMVVSKTSPSTVCNDGGMEIDSHVQVVHQQRKVETESQISDKMSK